ncbi:hypothetical protein BC831DRAFT_508989 [Entophlyctis helioformis]|nr:hypothetical protein BC831DRAFT_508989 [Entophlyctis helioformis]
MLQLIESSGLPLMQPAQSTRPAQPTRHLQPTQQRRAPQPVQSLHRAVLVRNLNVHRQMPPTEHARPKAQRIDDDDHEAQTPTQAQTQMEQSPAADAADTHGTPPTPPPLSAHAAHDQSPGVASLQHLAKESIRLIAARRRELIMRARLMGG